MILRHLTAFALAAGSIAACAQSSPLLPAGIGPDYDVPGDGDGDGDGDGSGDDGSDDGGGTKPAASCDDPSTCEYDLETTCGGKPVADPAAFPPCPTAVCGSGGHCVPEAALEPAEIAMLASCGSSSRCVPDRFIERGGLATAPSCSSLGGGEGRCLSRCLPAVAAKASLLSQDTCAPDELCTPCYDPFDGADTGACGISCDAGPALPKTTLPKCCADKGGGTCVPIDFVGAAEAEPLDAEECGALGAAASVCVPTQILNAHLVGVPFNAVECETSVLLQQLGLGSEGGCLPECIPIVDSLPVSQSSCSTGFKCVPCIDLNGDGTGACTNL